MKIDIYNPLAIHKLGMRDNQEDCIYPSLCTATKDDRLFIVCDGMGGHEYGEVASETVCSAIADFFYKNISLNDPFTDNTFLSALEYAYKQLDMKDDGAFQKMGTTLTLLYVHRRGVFCAHIGDSRIYHIRPNKGALYISRDHSLVFDLYQSGEISYEEMRNSPQKNIVTRAMTPGVENRMRPDIIHITDVQPSDYFYMCSDGMVEQMTNEELVSLLSSNISDEEKQRLLIKATANNIDNHSAWLIHIKDVIKETDDDNLVNEEPTVRCNALNIIPKTVQSNEDDVVIVQEVKKAKSLLQRMKKWLMR